jgi:cytochrome c oxidase subunit 4
MADTPHADADAGHGASLFRAYMIIAVVLTLCTATSFLFNYLAHEDVKVISRLTSFVLILGVAILKATLVAVYFMHLKWDWKRLYFLIFPAFILGAMMMMVLTPDILLGNEHSLDDEFQIAREFP